MAVGVFRRFESGGHVTSGDLRAERIRVREALPSDAEAIASTYNAYIDQGGSTFDVAHWSTPYVIKQLALPRPDGWFVAEDFQPKFLGWAAAHRFSARYGYRF